MNAATVILFTFLMGAIFLLLWLNMFRRWNVRWSWTWFLVQGLLVLMINLLLGQQQLYVVRNLYLVLTLETLAVFQRARSALLISGYYALLFSIDLVLSFIQNSGGVKLLGNRPIDSLWLTNFFGTSSNYLAILFFAIGYFAIYVQQLHSRTQLEAAHGELQTLATHIRELTLMTERQRMARELHDTLVQNLAGLIRQLDVASSLLACQRTERAQAILQESLASARSALVEARCAIGDLRTYVPPVAALGQAIHDEIDRFTSATGIVCQADLEALSYAHASHCEQVVRAVSEGLTNVARHAQARHTWIRAKKHGQVLTLEIGDDGVGFSFDSVIQTGHYGLIGLRERARLAQGHLEVKSGPGQGTVLLLHLPLFAEEK